VFEDCRRGFVDPRSAGSRADVEGMCCVRGP
jgi:hypothetical protein